MPRLRSVASMDEDGVVTTSVVQLTVDEEAVKDAEVAVAAHRIAVSWDVGDGGFSGGVYQIIANGTNKATARLEKLSLLTGNPSGDGSESYWIFITGGAKPSASKVTLVDGVGTVEFVPAASDPKGLSVVCFSLDGVGDSCPGALKIGIN